MTENENEAASRRATLHFLSLSVISTVAEIWRAAEGSAQEVVALKAYDALDRLLGDVEREAAAAGLPLVRPPLRRVQRYEPVECTPEVDALEVPSVWPIWPPHEPFPLTAKECLWLLRGYAIKPRSGPLATSTFERLPKRIALLNGLLFPC